MADAFLAVVGERAAGDRRGRAVGAATAVTIVQDGFAGDAADLARRALDAT